MERIRFSNNWNNKLSNKAFTTLRLHNPHKYRQGNRYEIEWQGKVLGIAVMRDIRHTTLANLNSFVTYLDTGYNVAQTINLLQTMYKNKGVNWNVQTLDFCLLVYEKQERKQGLSK
ncbi:hypothetical protein EZS27_016691 [termite gut metagenome]|uniref:Uncharacterized protein n=1 Tax=termite gut metagenome TaxID=433724 RepID=A0A5J4RMW6_9ZZZZ